MTLSRQHRNLTATLWSILTAFALTGCFTGVESTPKITESDVRRQQAANPTAEQLYTQGIESQAPSEWQRGKRFRVVDDKISLVFTSASSRPGSLLGRDLAFERFDSVPSLTGEGETEVVLTLADASAPERTDTFYYRYSTPLAALGEVKRLNIPFTIDMDLVADTDSVLRGRRFFIVTPNWYDATPARKAVNGYRHVEVEIDSVEQGNANYPLAVYFHLTDKELAATPTGEGERMVFMTVGLDKTSTRNFHALFSFDNPRKKYPQIEDDIWPLIIRSKIAKGMSRDECRLALGAPPTLDRLPSRAGMIERWSYSDGVYLIFEDGYLTRFRQ